MPLAPLRDPALVLATAAQVLGSKNGLAEHIADKSLLCLFDNFEHVVEAATDLAALVGACPNLAILVTSRERLRVSGEQTYPVPPLAEEDGEALFLTRARAIDPSFVPSAAVRELCLRLDELPLAIELAAARTALFNPEQLLDKLSQRLDLLKGERDADPRQRTLRATIEWSHDLLSEEEQRLFARLAVFAGGCTTRRRRRSQMLTPTPCSRSSTRALCESASHESALATGCSRRSASTPPRSSRNRAKPMTCGADMRSSSSNLAQEGTFVMMDSTWADRVDSDLDNVRVALDFAAATGESQRILRATASLRDFWFTRGYIAEGLTRLEKALSADIAPTPARCSALVAASMAAMIAGDDALAREHADEAMSLADSLGDPYLSALARYQDACVLTEDARWSEALAILDDVVPVLRDLGAWDVAIAANRTRAWAYEELGDTDRALLLYTENLEHSRTHGHRRIEARSLGVLAEIAADEGRLDEARELLLDSFRIDQELGNVPFMSFDLVRFAAVHIREGNAEVAARLIGRAVAGFDEIGLSLESWMTRELDEATEAAKAQLDEASFTAAWEAGAKMSLDDAIALALGQTAA